jgi:hypothetical protein
MTARHQGTPARGDHAAQQEIEPLLDIGRVDLDPSGLFTISRLMKKSRAVFIVGEARSGSTILFRSLLMQPAFRPKEENLQETSFISQVPSAGEFDQTAPRNLKRFILEDEVVWAEFLSDLQPIKFWLRIADRLGPNFRIRWLLSPSKLVARAFLFHAQRARGCERVIEKTPGHVEHIPRLLRSFPRAHILYVHRHPVDVYSSYVRRGMVDPKADWARISVDEFTQLYQRRAQKVLRAQRRRPEVVRLVRYGDFTADPLSELEALCDFLDADFDPKSLMELIDPDRWAHWERSRHLYEGIKEHTKDWRDFLSSADAQRIQNRLAKEMSALGHDPYEVGDHSRSRSAE